MRRSITNLLAIAALGLTAASAFARDIEDGKLLVYPQPNDRYKVAGTIGDKVAFYGIVGDQWETAHNKGKDITGLLLKDGDKATDAQKHIVYVTAQQLKIDAYVEIGGKEQKIEEAAPNKN